MKFVFVGPSLPDAHELADPHMKIVPPATQGDIMKALRAGATAIGLIDGQFEFVAPVWHKEILFALSQGVPVYGSSSMGALRAAECSAFGMSGVGRIYQDYKAGRRWDDGDVALLHAPPELRYAPLSIPLVNVDATLAKARALNLLTQDEYGMMSSAARDIFFKDRTWRLTAEVAGVDPERFKTTLSDAWVDQKRLDALELIGMLKQIGLKEMSEAKPDWTFNPTPLWRSLYY